MIPVTNIVGIEIGSNKCTISSLTTRGLNKIESEASNIEIPVLVSFTENERIFSEQAQVQLKRNAQNTFKHIIKLVELGKNNINNNSNNNQQINNPFQLNVIENGNFVIEFSNKQKFIIRPEQVFTSYLTYLNKLIGKKLGGTHNYSSVISIPSYFDQIYIRFIQELAQKVVKLPNLAIIHEHVAIGYAYLWTQQQELKNLQGENKSKNVLFFDFGESKCSLYSMNVTDHKAVINFVDTIKIGVSDFDLVICDHVLKEFQRKFPSFNRNDKKAQLKLLDSIQKQRKILSGLDQVNLIVEYFYEDEDLNFNLTRETFNKLLDENFGMVLGQFLQNSFTFLNQIGVSQFDEIQILGGGTRIPWVKNILQVFVGEINLSVSLNIESISRGCAIYCSKFIGKASNYQVLSVSNSNYMIKVGESLLPLQKNQLYIYKERMVLQNVSQNQEIKVEIYCDNILEKFILLEPKQIQEEIQQFNLFIDFQIESDGDVQIADFGILNENQNMEQIPAQENHSNKPYNLKIFNQSLLTEQQFKELIECEILMQNTDYDFHQFIDTKNKLEETLYKSIHTVKEQISVLVGPQQTQQILEQLQQLQNWQEGFQSSLNIKNDFQQYKSQLEQLNQLMAPFLKMLASQQQVLISIKDLEMLRKLKEDSKKKNSIVEAVKLDLRGLNIQGEQGMIQKMNIFQKKGVDKFLDLLQKFPFGSYVEIDLGNNNLTDESLLTILNTFCYSVSNFKVFKFYIDSNLQIASSNKTTSKSVIYISQLVQLMVQIQEIDLCLNHIDDNSLLNLQNVLYDKKQLKILRIKIRNGQISKQTRERFKQVINSLQLLVFEFEYFNQYEQKEE